MLLISSYHAKLFFLSLAFKPILCHSSWKCVHNKGTHTYDSQLYCLHLFYQEKYGYVSGIIYLVFFLARGTKSSPFWMLLSRCNHHLLLNLRISVLYFLKPWFREEVLINQNSSSSTKMHSPRNPRRLTSNLSRNPLTTKWKRKHCRNTEFYFYDKENFTTASPLVGWLVHGIGSLRYTEILPESEVRGLCLGYRDMDTGCFTHFGKKST